MHQRETPTVYQIFEAESAVGVTQGLARTLKDFVEYKSGKVIDPKSPLLGWLIEHAGTLCILYAYDENARDGLTPYRKIRGRDWNIALPPFGECVDYRVRTNRKLDYCWDTGLFLGIRLRRPKGSGCGSIHSKEA